MTIFCIIRDYCKLRKINFFRRLSQHKNIIKVKNKTKFITAFTLIEIMVVIAIIATLAVIAIPAVIRSKIIANETSAQNTLRVISRAFESYAYDNDAYPAQETYLLETSPPYLNRLYNAQRIQGYLFSYNTISDTRYVISARPAVPRLTGVITYVITTGGVVTTQDD